MKKIYELIKKFFIFVFKRVRNNNDNSEHVIANGEEKKIEKGLILSNGVALNESILFDRDLTAIERSYLIIMLFRFDAFKGYAEISLNEFLRLTGTSNKGNIVKIIDRLVEKGVISKIQGSGKESNRFFILKHMLRIESSKIKIGKSDKNDTSNQNDTTLKDDIVIESKDISFEDNCHETRKISCYAAEAIKYTCKKTIKTLNQAVQDCEDLCNKTGVYLEKLDK